MKHLNRLAALALSVSMGISGCAFAPASSASSETVSSTYEKDKLPFRLRSSPLKRRKKTLQKQNPGERPHLL